jgi:hypothetical protein
MRKIYSLITAVCVTASLTATAGTINRTDDSRSNLFSEHFTKRIPESVTNLAKQNKLQPGMSFNGMTVKRQAPAKKNVAPKAAATNDIIYEAPEGRVENFYRNSYAYYVFYYYAMEDQDYGFAGEVVFADNGDVYIKNPISTVALDSYIKGHLDNDVISVELPQKVYEEEYEGVTYEYSLYAVTYDPDEDEASLADNQTVTFSYKDGVIKQNEDVILGLCDPDTGEWTYYGDTNFEFYPFNDTLVSAPSANAEAKLYAFSTDAGASKINVLKDGNDVYFQGLSQYFPEAWVKGSIDGTEVTIPSEQYVGVDYYHYVYFYGAKAVEAYMEDYDYYYTSYELTENLKLQYDADADTYTFDENTGIVYNLGKEEYYADDSFIGYKIVPQGDISESIPSDPAILDDMDYDDEYGYGGFAFSFYDTDTKGNILPTDQLYYNVYVDGEVFTLYSDEYDLLDEYEELTDIPYDFTNDDDVIAYGTTHYFFYYFEGAESIGVQTIYKSANGNEYRSNIVYVGTDGVNNVLNDAAKTVKSETYYDLTGRIINTPANGLFIKKTTFADGSSKAVKVVK